VNVSEVNLLLVEDDEVDVKAVKHALRNLQIASPLTVASDGIEALEILRGENGVEPMKRPYLVLLDLNVPRMGGMRFLDELRRDPEPSGSLVFVVTTSADEGNRFGAYDRRVAGSLLKYSTSRTFVETASTVDHCWHAIELPN
jgi:CheY-like chemotaxis protein